MGTLFDKIDLIWTICSYTVLKLSEFRGAPMNIHKYYFEHIKNLFQVIIFYYVITLFCVPVYAANHYVDKNASGSNNGTSWSNAWQNLSNVQWSTLGAGDTLFISGGTSSTIYNETLTIGASGNANGLLVVTKGRTTGHNGEVILDGGNTGFGIYVQNDQYVKVSDLTIRNMDLGARILDPANVIRIENCNMYNLHGGGIDISGYNGTYNTDQVDSVFIVNCSVVSHETNGNQTDGIDIAYCQNIFITDSYVSVDNVGEAHTDIIQTYQIAKNVTLKRNRLENLIDKTINPSSGANGLMMDKLVGTITIDNNVLRTPNFNAGAGICAALFAYSQSDPPLVYFYNNTCIWDNATNAFSFGSSSYPVASGSKYKNNIFYSTGLTGGADPVNFGPNSSCSNVSNNIFYSSAGSWSGGSNCSSPHANPMFTNPGSDWTLQGGSPAIDAGIDLGSEYQKDRAGNLRTGTWDLGAYEYVGGGGGNNPPNPPTNPNPGNGAVNQPTSLTLTWSCTDPNGDPLTYDVYFGTTNNPPLVSGNQTGTSYNPGGLSNSTTYYWKIVAKDNHGASTAGPVWSFSTAAAGNNPPNQPSNPNPEDGAMNVAVNLTLTWSCSDPEGDPLTYDVYFGTSNNPPLVVSNQTSASYDLVQLDNNTTYYWKITAKDNSGNSTVGTVWNFITVAAAGDLIPPELALVQIVEPDNVVLDFSEPLDTVSVLNLSDYHISNQVEVTGVEIYPSHKRICLNTTNHDTDFVYSITVNNIKDTSGNVITSQYNSAFYKLVDISPVTYTEYLMEEVEASSTSDTTTSPAKTLDGLGMGDPDPSSRWASEFLPQWIQYDLGSTQTINLIASSFYRWDQGRVYQYSIQTSDNSVLWNDVVTNASSSSQEWTLNEFGSLEARYVRIICLSNNEADWAGLWETHIFGPDSITPVEFTSFTANPENGDVHLSWITSTEKNNHMFLIEKKKGDNGFSVIGSVPGNGTTTEPHSYSFIDKSVSTGTYSYRIKQVDFNGKFGYSNTIEIAVVWPTEFVVEQNYPNPFNPTTTIQFFVPHNSMVRLAVFNVIGEEVALLVNEEKQIGVYNIEFNAKDMPSGIYFYRFQSGNFTMTKKMILLK